MLKEEQERINTANGLPPLTDKDIDGFKKDPDYFIKKIKADQAKNQPINESNTPDNSSDEPVSNHRIFNF